jgi:hypothetical protein
LYKLTREVILTQLHHRVGTLVCARVAQSHRAHWPKRQRLRAALGDDLHGQTALEERPRLHACADGVFKCPQFDPLSGLERGHEGFVFLFRERTVDVIAVLFAHVVTRGAEGDLHVDRVRADDGCDGVEEIEMLRAVQRRDGFRKPRRRERSRRDDDGRRGNLRHLLADEANARVRFDPLGDALSE